ncbi:hypothetical protein FQR65_LT11730 [Abscondita terminalis]|nr:hypothetical protein FQR65_LT11730 [Abscondita terminalis]
MSNRPTINTDALSVKFEDDVLPLMPKLLEEVETKKNNSGKALKTIKKTTCAHPTPNTKTCLKCFVANRIWMVSINMYDIMGLLDICPCGTLHSIRPYIKMSNRPTINTDALSVKFEDDVLPLMPKLLEEVETKKNNSGKTLKTIKKTTCAHPTPSTKTCLKCFVANRIWMVSINMYDIMGLLDICPCGTLHSIRPYISYKIK